MTAAKKLVRAWRDELDLIAKRHGGKLRPEDVVEFARDPSTALHVKFTWDDTEAARQHRLWQARSLISIVVTTLPGQTKEFRAFVSMQDDRKERGGGYRFTIAVLSDKEKRAKLLAEALADFDRWKEKYETLEELGEVFAARRKVV